MHEQISPFTKGAGGPTRRERRALNLSYLSDQERARTLEAFEHLSPADSLEIVTKRPSSRLVPELQARYGTLFYWWPFERGPLAWQAILAKPALNAPATVVAVISADHLRLRELWAQFESGVALCQIDLLHRRSAELSFGLRRYVDIEETVLLPLLEAQTQMSAAGLTKWMRTEHRRLGRILDWLDRLRATTECAAILEAFNRPVEPMTPFQKHCLSEEAALYPFMDIVFDPGEEHELLSRVQAFEI
jgi:uncharacterized protein (DUF2249 family)